MISRKMLAALSEIGQKLASTRDLDALLGRILDLAIDSIRAERGIMFLKSSTDGQMRVSCARGIGNTDLEDLTTFSRSVLRRAEQGLIVFSTDVGQDPSLASVHSIIVREIRSILCVPMKSRDEVLGVIYLDTRSNAQKFTDKDRTFVESFASQAAIAIANARVFGQMREENSRLRRQAASRFPELIGTSVVMRRLHETIAGVLDLNSTILITGESGTGKGLIARAIHANGARRQGPFLTVDCGALPEGLLEVELFGCRRGAFTGADRDRVGLLEEASGGTLFLDEIANTSINLQSRLLRVLQEREIRRLGENQTRRVNVRVIAATNADLSSLIAQGRFRQDLFYRLNVIGIVAPTLRERREDIPLLVAEFLSRQAHANTPPRELGPGVLEALLSYSWPGNVRELEHLIESLMVVNPREVITIADLPDTLPSLAGSADSGRPGLVCSRPEVIGSHEGLDSIGGVRDVRGRVNAQKTGEQIMIEDALRRFRGDKTKAARFIGWNRQKLYRRIRSFAIPTDFGKAA